MCLALDPTKLAGSLTIPRGALRGPRLLGPAWGAARPGWGPSQGLLLLSMKMKSPWCGGFCPGREGGRVGGLKLAALPLRDVLLLE